MENTRIAKLLIQAFFISITCSAGLLLLSCPPTRTAPPFLRGFFFFFFYFAHALSDVYLQMWSQAEELQLHRLPSLHDEPRREGRRGDRSSEGDWESNSGELSAEWRKGKTCAFLDSAARFWCPESDEGGSYRSKEDFAEICFTCLDNAMAFLLWLLWWCGNVCVVGHLSRWSCWMWMKPQRRVWRKSLIRSLERRKLCSSDVTLSQRRTLKVSKMNEFWWFPTLNL